MHDVQKRGKSYRAQVRKAGHRPMSKTFSTARAAKDWKADMERELREGVVTDPSVKIVKLIERYAEELGPKRKNLAASHLKHDIPAIKRKFKDMKMADLQGDGLTDWVFRENLTASTSGWHINRLFGVLRQCELKWKVRVPWRDMRRCYENLKDSGYITAARVRDRRVSDVELHAIKSKLHPLTARWACDMFDFSLATAMRIGEVCRIRWDDFDAERRTVIIRDRKHPKKKMGNHKVVPLLGGAFEIAQRQPREGDRIFPRSTHYMSKVFHEAVVAAEIEDMVLHDLRHEGISRLFELGFQIQEVALVSGHEDWKTLRRYTHLRPASLVDREKQLRALLAA